MKEKIKIAILIFLGLILALGCIAWSLKGEWKLINQNRIAEIIPSAKKEILPVVSLAIDPQEKTLYQGGDFTADIMLESEEELLAVDLFLSYDPQILSLEKITPGKFFPSPQEFSKEIKEEEGKIFYALGSLSPTSGKGILVSLTFQGKMSGDQGTVGLTEETLVSTKGGEEVNIELSREGRYSILELVK